MSKNHLWKTGIVLMAVLSGCSPQNVTADSNKQYLFDDPNIMAYVNGEAVYETSCAQYMEFNTLMMQEYKDLDTSVDPDFVEMYEGELDDQKLIKNNLETFKTQAIKYLALSDQEKVEDYYRSFIIKSKLKELMNKRLENLYESYFEPGIIEGVQAALDKGGDTDDIYLNISVIEKIAEKYNLTYENTVEVIYKPWLENEYAYYLLVDYYLNYEYMGFVIKWNGDNTDEFIRVLENVLQNYMVYTDELLDSAEIVERP